MAIQCHGHAKSANMSLGGLGPSSTCVNQILSRFDHVGQKWFIFFVYGQVDIFISTHATFLQSLWQPFSACPSLTILHVVMKTLTFLQFLVRSHYIQWPTWLEVIGTCPNSEICWINGQKTNSIVQPFDRIDEECGLHKLRVHIVVCH